MKHLVTFSGEIVIKTLFVGNKEIEVADSSAEGARKAIEAEIASEWQEFLCLLHRHGIDVTSKESEIKVNVHNVSSATGSTEVSSQSNQHQP